MNWIVLSLLSAVFLGLYEIAKKESLRGNAVPVVLLFNVLTSASVYVPVILVSRLLPGVLPSDLVRVDDLGVTGHLMLAGKSLLAGSSWVFASFALKHLPVSIAAPIRASSPFVTILAGCWSLVSVLRCGSGWGCWWYWFRFMRFRWLVVARA